MSSKNEYICPIAPNLSRWDAHSNMAEPVAVSNRVYNQYPKDEIELMSRA